MSRDPTDAVVALLVLLTPGIAILTGLFVSLLAGVIVLVLGWFVLFPLVIGVTEFRRSVRGDAEPDAAADPLVAVQRDYVAGEIDEEELERRVDALLETNESEVAAVTGDDATRAVDH